MPADPQTAPTSKKQIWTGRVLATHVRVSDPLFSHVLFPVYLGLLIWGGLFLRDERLRALIPLRK